MVFKYTYDERHKLAEVEESYAQRLAEIEEDLKKQEAGSVEFEALIAEHIKLYDEQYQKLGDLEAQIEQQHFDQLGNDPDVILANGKEQTELILRANYEDRILYDIDEEGNPKSLDPKFESRTAISMLKHGLRLHFSALKGKPQHKELRDYIYNYVASSPYTYTDIKGERKEAEAATIEKKHPVPKINTYGIMNDKVNRTIINGDSVVQEADGQMRIIWGTNQAGIKKDEKVPVYVAMRYEGTEAKISKKMTAFDMAVYNAVSTLYYYHNRDNSGESLYVTPQDVWRTMNGIKDSRKQPTSKQTASVKKSLDKMRFTNFYMDISQEIDAHYITFNDERVKKGHIETYLLKADVASFETEKGNIVDGYRIENEPILYSYNNAKNHVLFVNYDLLDTSDMTGNEGYTIEFRNYLLQQIQLMNNHTRNSRKILYETIYKETAIPSPADRIHRTDYATENSYKTTVKREAQNDRKKIAALLDSWKAKGWIKDYKPIMKGRSYSGVEIQLQPEQKQLPDKK